MVVDNFSRKVWAWRLEDSLSPVSSRDNLISAYNLALEHFALCNTLLVVDGENNNSLVGSFVDLHDLKKN